MPGKLVETYTVKLIPPDLRQEEFVLRFCNALQELNDISGEICNRITTKIRDEGKNFEKINERIKRAQTKVNKLKENQKATQIFSSAKYQNSDNSICKYDRHFNFNTLPTNQIEDIEADIRGFDTKVMEDKKQLLKLMHMVNNIITNKLCKFSSSYANEGGLGPIPSGLNSISSLLLFNTSHNPYNQPDSTDHPDTVARQRRQQFGNQATESLLGEAPLSMRERAEDFWKGGSKDSLIYNPDIGNVPVFDLPDYLPDLTCVANDLNYSGDYGQSIAPSVPVSLLSSLPDLPTFTSTPAPQKTSEPPLPPPPMPSLATKIESESGKFEKNLAVREATKTGDCEPMVAEVSLNAAFGKEVPRLPETPVSVVRDAPVLVPPPPPPAPPMNQIMPSPAAPHMNLMEAIRKAGGTDSAKLKKSNERKLKPAKAPINQSASMVDILSDLSSKLALRRKGMTAGNSAKEKGEIGAPKTPLELLKDRIPVLPSESKKSEMGWE